MAPPSTTSTTDREPPDPKASLAATVRARRAELDITKSEAARRAGVSRRTWHEVEEGLRVTSTVTTLSQFEQALQLPEGYLYALTVRSGRQEVEDLRQRAIGLVKLMAPEELQVLIASRGTENLRSLLLDLKADNDAMLRQLTELDTAVEELRSERRNAAATPAANAAIGGRTPLTSGSASC